MSNTINHPDYHFQLRQISDHVYWLPPSEATDRPTLGVVVGERGTLVIDAGNSPAHAQLLLDQLTANNLPQPRYVALTHWHWDHVFGMSCFDAPILAQAETAETLADMATWSWDDQALAERVKTGVEIEFCREHILKEMPAPRTVQLRTPDVVFQDNMTIDLGDITCQAIHVGGDHASDSTIYVIPDEKIMFLSDALYQRLYAPQPHYTAMKVFSLVASLLAYDVNWYLWGHDPTPMSRVEFLAFTDRLEKIGEAVMMAGKNREQIIANLATEGVTDLGEDDMELIEFFEAGL